MLDFKIDESAVVKSGKEWLAGYFDGNIFKYGKTIKKLSDIKDVSSYVTLKRWLKSIGENPDREDEVLKETGMEKIYILNKPIEPGIREFEKYWWKDYCKLCKKCKKECKQSRFAIVQNCRDFVKKG